MADKSFGVKELNLLNASGTPTITSPNNLNLNANTVAISTSVTVGQNITVSANAGIASLNVTGIATITRPSTDNSIQRYVITNNSNSDYRFTGPGQDGAENDPDIYLVRGHRYVFTHNATTDHPIQIRVASGGAAYTDGVTYSDTGNNRTTQGNDLIINVQHDAPARLYYQCTSHSGMVGNIYIVGGPQVISGVVTATTFSGSGASLTNLPAANLTGILPALAAPNLTSLPAANLTGTLPAISGANLTSLPAANLTGTLPAISGANLTSLPSQLTLSNNANNRVITGGSGVNLNGEAGLTFDGTNFNFSRQDAGDARMYIYGGEGGDARLLLASDEGDDHIDTYEIRAQASDNALAIYQFESGSYNERLRIDNGGKIGINETSPAQQLHIHDDTNYQGILINGNGAPRIAFARSTTTTGEWSVGIDGTNGTQFVINNSNDNSARKLIISSSGVTAAGTLTSGGNCTFNGVVTFNGSYQEGNSTSGLAMYGSASMARGVVLSHGANNFRPTHTNDVDLGTSSIRWKQIYTNNSVNTSDKNLKNTILDSDLGLSFINKLRPVSYKWNQKEEESLDTKTHYGLIAQEIETALTSEGKTLNDFAGVFKPDDYKDDGTGGAMGISLGEIISPLIKAVQELSAKVAALEGS